MEFIQPHTPRPCRCPCWSWAPFSSWCPLHFPTLWLCSFCFPFQDLCFYEFLMITFWFSQKGSSNNWSLKILIKAPLTLPVKYSLFQFLTLTHHCLRFLYLNLACCQHSEYHERPMKTEADLSSVFNSVVETRNDLAPLQSQCIFAAWWHCSEDGNSLSSKQFCMIFSR